jgi:HAMP domain-containing protein
MKLLAKFNLIFALSCGIGFFISALFSHWIVQRNAENQVVQQAHLMSETALSMRTYTSEQIDPLLKNLTGRFYPQSIPFYAATEGFNYLRQKYPDYTYKEATLNPTNLRDRATDWEADIINSFRNDPSLNELVGTRPTPLGDALYLARPIKITDTSCLQCHSEPDNAPSAMVRTYGSSNGFGWKLNDIVGAQIVQVPSSVPIKMANASFNIMLFSLAGVFVLTLVILNVMLYLTVIQPVGKLSALADLVSAGKRDVEEIPVKGKDEVSVLANSFNRMQRSLMKALKMLDE